MLRLFSRNSLAAVVPVIMLVESISEEDRARAQRNGVLDVILPRLDSSDTQADLSSVIQKWSRTSARDVESGEATLDQLSVVLRQELRSGVFTVERRDEEGRVKLVYGISAAQAAQIERRAVQQAVETLRTRVDQFGVAEPLIQTSGEKRIILEMPGASNVEDVKRIVGSVAKLEFRLTPVPGSTTGTKTLKDRSGAQVQVEDEVLMAGDAVQTASTAFPQGQFEVMLTLTSEGGRLFRKITTEHVQRNLAIILDNVVYSSPTIREPIPNGQASISGSFTETEARDLAVVLRSGALPAPLKVLEERTVGPSLGMESIRAGLVAILVGFVAIVLFMAVYYKKAGWVANQSLLINLILCTAALSAFGATLTLPGLAGLALTIGMAVDSNVLIFERIRDELANGSSRDAAVDSGFRHAWRAIIDTHVTTLLTGLVLYFLGTGPIKGFAVTLIIGILATLYCATFASRLLFDLLPLSGKDRRLSI
ncbi:MAG: protein translocase subunit SecD [Proteobacteria bacterium]|nr:protein translocase subunit SecD [Pseudomonadota bacterium]